MAHDASHFLLLPQRGGDAARRGRGRPAARSCSRRTGVPLTFRSGGTSLSGQAVTDGILVDTRRHFRASRCSTAAPGCASQPGATVRQVNARLARLRPQARTRPGQRDRLHASAGCVANNSAGMACGTVANSYRTLESLLARAAERHGDRHRRPGRRRAAARRRSPTCYEGLAGAARPGARPTRRSVATIEQQFSMKNTMGYGLNSLLDHDTPGRRSSPTCVVGSEGTLAFVAEVVVPHGAAAAPTLARRCWCSTTSSRPPRRCPRWSPPARPPSSCWTPPRCGSARPTRTARRGRCADRRWTRARRAAASSTRPPRPRRWPSCTAAAARARWPTAAGTARRRSS